MPRICRRTGSATALSSRATASASSREIGALPSVAQHRSTAWLRRVRPSVEGAIDMAPY